MKTKMAVVGLITIITGVLVFTRTKNAPPADLRDAVASQDFDTAIPVFENNNGNIPVPKAAVPVETQGFSASGVNAAGG